MIRKTLIGGICMCLVSVAYVGSRLAPEVLREPVFAAEATPTGAPDSSSPIELQPPARHANPDLLRGIEAPADEALRAVAATDSADRAALAMQPVVLAESEELAWSPEPAAAYGESYDGQATVADSRLLADDEQLERCISDLHDDRVRGNAMEAMGTLIANGWRSLPALERALHSDDEQQRTLAAVVSVRIGGYTPTPMLAGILLGALTPAGGGSYSEITPRPWIDRVGRAGFDERGAAFEAFCSDPSLFQQVELDLEQRLDGPLSAARFDAAYLIASHPGVRSRERAFEVLIEHLADNQLNDDAAQAMRLLARTPAETVYLACNALPGRDTQQTRLLRHFLARFDPENEAGLKLEPKQLSAMGFDCGDMLAEASADH